MTEIAERVRSLLEENGVEYEQIHHEQDFTALDTADHTHTPGRRFAKAVVVRVAGEHALAVLPSHHVVDVERLGFALGGKQVELALEDEIDEFSDCEAGAIPPFGNLYGLPVYVSPALAEEDRITCVAGSHSEAVRFAYRDFERLVQPRQLDFSVVRHGHRPEDDAPQRG